MIPWEGNGKIHTPKPNTREGLEGFPDFESVHPFVLVTANSKHLPTKNESRPEFNVNLRCNHDICPSVPHWDVHSPKPITREVPLTTYSFCWLPCLSHYQNVAGSKNAAAAACPRLKRRAIPDGALPLRTFSTSLPCFPSPMWATCPMNKAPSQTRLKPP